MWFVIILVAVALGFALLAGYLAMRLNAEIDYSDNLERLLDQEKRKLQHQLNLAARWQG